MLGQSELTILVDPRLPSKIYQGITTEITGEGDSVAPLNDAMIAADRAGYEHSTSRPTGAPSREYFTAPRKAGHGHQPRQLRRRDQVRRMVLGDADVQPTPAQLAQMQALVRDAMRDGAVGVSTALQYAPAPYAKTDELIALASEAAPLRRHLRHPHAQRGRRRSSRPSTKPSASAARRTSRSRSGI